MEIYGDRKGGEHPGAERLRIEKRRGHVSVGIHSLNSFSLIVPDVSEADRFYRSFGLETGDNRNVLAIGTSGSDTIWGGVREGARKKLEYVSFGLYEQDVAAFVANLDEYRVRRTDPPRHCSASNGVWFYDPDGNLIEVVVAEKTSLYQKQIEQPTIAKLGEPGFRRRASPVRPRRLAHILLFSTDVARSIEFYRDVLGLKLSDRSGDIIAFMHGRHGSDHHLIAFAKSNAPGLHHVSWDVGSIDEIGSGAMQMAQAGFRAGWGLGRHVLGSNYFHYVRDPWGSYCEYSHDIDYVPAQFEWQAGDHPGDDSIFAWGPNMPDDFVHNYEGD